MMIVNRITRFRGTGAEVSCQVLELRRSLVIDYLKSRYVVIPVGSQETPTYSSMRPAVPATACGHRLCRMLHDDVDVLKARDQSIPDTRPLGNHEYASDRQRANDSVETAKALHFLGSAEGSADLWLESGDSVKESLRF